jgi:hypothetical protein
MFKIFFSVAYLRPSELCFFAHVFVLALLSVTCDCHDILIDIVPVTFSSCFNISSLSVVLCWLQLLMSFVTY